MLTREEQNEKTINSHETLSVWSSKGLAIAQGDIKIALAGAYSDETQLSNAGQKHTHVKS